MEDSRTERELKGLAVSKGIAHGEAFVMLHRELDTPVYEIRDADKPAERARFENAILKTRADIQQIKAELAESVGETESGIFDAHLLVLEDVAIMQETIETFESGNYNIEYCYSSTVNKFINAVEKIDDPFIRERIADLKDVSRR
ncbi:MAG: phosphoenolpyruvate--protein phosphotransferase, partial [Opitutales bacterium]|nr:phosphoenolpyruvate--protein phosphotransferase [Opitutales bacterium]